MRKDYTNHGVIDVNETLLWEIVNRTKAEPRIEFASDHWHISRNNTEFKVKDIYHHDSCAYDIYDNDDIEKCLPNDFWDKFGIDKSRTSYQFLHYLPGRMIPPHIDRYNFVKKKFNLSVDHPIKRILITCCAPTFGFATFIENSCVHDVPKFTALTWASDAMHSACNVGIEDRYVLTVTAPVL